MVGDTSAFDARLQSLMRSAQEAKAHNDAITLTIAAAYGGRSDVLQAVKSWQTTHPGESVDALDEQALGAHLSLSYAPDPDLLIRTSGEMRVSNFLLWQISYTELVVTPTLWPDFRKPQFFEAIEEYANRHRRFGLV